MLFDSFEAYDVQETRKISREEGREEGRKEQLIELVCRKIKRNYTVSDIAEMLEERPDTIQEIYDVAIKYAPEYDSKAILAELQANRKSS